MAWPDEVVERWVTAHRSARLVELARQLTWAGDSRVVGPVVVAVGAALAWRARRWQPLVLAAAGWLGLEAGARALKAAVDRPRPPLRDAVVVLANGSLPAAHVARAILALTVLALVVPPACRRWFVPAAVVLVAAVGWSRLELGSHWLTDTLVAWPLGLLAALPLARWQGRHRNQRAPAPADPRHSSSGD